MSTGKGTKSIRKSQQGNDLLPSVGFLNTVAKHKATLNQTVINLGSLTTPPEATALGFIQPSGGTLAALDLQRYKNNVKVMSTAKGLMDNPIDYRITGTAQITLADGAADGEIFTIMVESQPRNGINIVAAQPKVASYLLPAGQTDIPAGTYTVNKNPGEDVGEFIVIVDRQVQYRNTGNGSSGGDYQEIAGLVRMNDYDPINDRKVVLVWVGALVDNPQDTQLALIQTLQGQIDAMVPTLAALAGVSESVFQTSPNDPDLLAFSATVIDLAARIAALESVTYVNGVINFTSTTVANTYVDVSGTTIVLPAGQWELVYNGLGYVDNITGGTFTLYGNAAITDSSNNLMDSALTFIGGPVNAGQSLAHHIHLVARVSAGTYKLRIRCSESAATGKMGIGQVSYTGGLTDPDTNAKWYARKVGN
jgi:hypothetical protein